MIEMPDQPYQPNMTEGEKSKQLPEYVKFIRSGHYEIDTTKLIGVEGFPCPKCEVTISPDDKTDEIYMIINTKTKNEKLLELTIQCNKCKSIIRLTNFQDPYTKKKEKE